MKIEVYNEKLGERLNFEDEASLLLHLWNRLTTRGHYLLQYDDVTVTAPDGWTHVHRGPYVLLHALAGVAIPGVAVQPTVSIAAVAAGRQQE